MSNWKVDVSVKPGGSETFTSFVERSGHALRQALVAAYGPEAGIEATAEALAYGWEHWGRLVDMKNPAGYLYRVGQSRARRSVFRKQPVFDLPEPTPGSTWFEPGLGPALTALSNKQRSAVVLIHGYGWTVTEVAEMWGVTFSTVKAHLDAGMKKLRKRMGVDR